MKTRMAVRYATRSADLAVTRPSVTRNSEITATPKNSKMLSTQMCTTNQRQ